MKNRLLLAVIMFFVLGSASVSNMDSLSYTFKSVFHVTAMTVLITIGLVGVFNYWRKKRA
ncbi:hypothetical protein [Oceanobacillus sp. CAU 1775]